MTRRRKAASSGVRVLGSVGVRGRSVCPASSTGEKRLGVTLGGGPAYWRRSPSRRQARRPSSPPSAAQTCSGVKVQLSRLYVRQGFSMPPGTEKAESKKSSARTASGAAAAFQQRQRQQSVERQRFFRYEDAPILRQRRAKESAVQRIVEVGKRASLPAFGRALCGPDGCRWRRGSKSGERGRAAAWSLPKPPLIGSCTGGQRADEIVRRVMRGIGLTRGSARNERRVCTA